MKKFGKIKITSARNAGQSGRKFWKIANHFSEGENKYYDIIVTLCKDSIIVRKTFI